MPHVDEVDVDDFEQLYRADPDPWQFATSPYEQRRYDITAACLPNPRYCRAFEPGCAIGELTRRLAERCDEVVAWDGSPAVVAAARNRLDGVTNVRLQAAAIPRQWPQGRFDLVVISEIGYYFDAAKLRVVTGVARSSLDAGGTLLAVHWLGESQHHLLHGDEVHDVIGSTPRLVHGGAFRDGGFRLDWWTPA